MHKLTTFREMSNAAPPAARSAASWRASLYQPHEVTLSAELPQPRCGAHRLKLVVNSYEPYTTPRAALFASLYRSGFARFEDVIVVLGGSMNDTITTQPLPEDASPASRTVGAQAAPNSRRGLFQTACFHRG